MMVTKAEYDADPSNIEVVTNYHGHEATRVNHDRDCPHYNESKADLSGVKSADCTRCWISGPLYMKTSHVGLVLNIGEYNGYDDSDFYADVWNPTLNKPERITYASTRGWTYPNGATIDATPEVRAAYDAYVKHAADESRKARMAREAKVPSIGRTVKVVAGRKVPLDAIGEVVWFGIDKFYRNYYENPMARAMGFLDTLHDVQAGKYRIGLMIDGRKVFTNAKNVEVVDPASVGSTAQL
jgi:hypothetical protein